MGRDKQLFEDLQLRNLVSVEIETVFQNDDEAREKKKKGPSCVFVGMRPCASLFLHIKDEAKLGGNSVPPMLFIVAFI